VEHWTTRLFHWTLSFASSTESTSHDSPMLWRFCIVLHVFLVFVWSSLAAISKPETCRVYHRPYGVHILAIVYVSFCTVRWSQFSAVQVRVLHWSTWQMERSHARTWHRMVAWTAENWDRLTVQKQASTMATICTPPTTIVRGEWVSSVLRPHQHSIGYTGDGFYRSKVPTNSIKVLKEDLQKTKKTTKTTIYRYT